MLRNVKTSLASSRHLLAAAGNLDRVRSHTGAKRMEPSVKQILVVDDERLIRTIMSEILKSHGYSVMLAPSADEAREVLDENGRCDMVITDIQMPGAWDGLALTDHVAREIPELPVLIMTGRPELLGRPLRGNERFLSKPFGADQLMAKIDELETNR
jgi:CheY-like chemotaxis protein